MRPLHVRDFSVVLLLSTLVACGEKSDRNDQAVGQRVAARDEAAFVGSTVGNAVSAAPAAAMAPAMASPRRVMARRSASVMGDAEVGEEVQTTTPGPTPREVDAAAMLIRTATASVEVTSLDSAVSAARRTATRYGGMVANAQVATGRNEVHRAVLQIRIPAVRFDSLLSGIAPLGRVESVAVNAEDVGEEYVDIEARLVNLHRLEARLIDLLANRTGKLTDVLTVERELARIRGEIEQIEGRRRFLQRSVALSTLELTLHEPEPVIAGTPGTNPIAAAVRDAWRNFVALMAWSIAALGVVVPVAAIILAAAIVARRGMRRFTLTGSASGARGE
jgi:hypothetical protein